MYSYSTVGFSGGGIGSSVTLTWGRRGGQLRLAGRVLEILNCTYRGSNVVFPWIWRFIQQLSSPYKSYFVLTERNYRDLDINKHITMVSWDSLIRFTADDLAEYWAALALDQTPQAGLQVDGFASIEDLESDKGSKKVTVKKVR